LKRTGRSFISLVKCAIVLLFLGASFYLNREADHRRERFQQEAIRSASTVLFFDPIDINHADAKALEALPGIGPFLAREIMQYRRQHGFFKKPSDLLDVKGIGPKRLKQITPHLVFKTPLPASPTPPYKGGVKESSSNETE